MVRWRKLGFTSRILKVFMTEFGDRGLRSFKTPERSLGQNSTLPGPRQQHYEHHSHVTNSLWLATYLTIPLFFYDYLLLGIYLDLGIQFVFPYWYLTFFYFSFWIQFPLIAFWLSKSESEVS